MRQEESYVPRTSAATPSRLRAPLHVATSSHSGA
jgi:hypothetical protein